MFVLKQYKNIDEVSTFKYKYKPYSVPMSMIQ